MMIHAAVLRDRTGPFGIEEVDLAAPGPGEVLVRVAGAGLCRSDLMPRHVPIVSGPVVLGHEGAGVVEDVGPGVTRVRPGDHVVLSYDSCGWCARCLGGEPSYCGQFFPRNLSGRRVDGSTSVTDAGGEPVAARWFGQSSFATHCIAAERGLVPVDASLPLETLAPLGCGIQTGAGTALLALRAGAGSTLAVFGTGAVGLAAVMAAAAAGAREIVAVDTHPKRRELALELGATHALDGADPETAARIAALTGGGADAALDTTSVPEVVLAAVTSLRPRGTCALVGSGAADVVLPPRALLGGQTLRYVMEGDAVPQQFIPVLIALWQNGRFPFDRLVRTYPLSGINDAERDFGNGDVVKPVLVPAA
ncbi:NAD(P)-dependent alcohol dehydrogenase [Streptomyces sp. NRRL F-5123]|uniref:NAD(P)-dependent alcohol dehydrogenase n=1 Tax=Streptomyces sp. NRRL F-5123 TaxID=1463856 RepID=UPI0004E0F406|nr:NAD(P)-dependent alcohol dehydrogenase [Streptomyces sp. NRRL F-5123]